MRAFALRVVRLCGYLALTLPLMPLQAIFVARRSSLALSLPILYHRLCWRILGFRVVERGERSRRRPTLFVANHVSYLDITILGGLIKGYFVAKAEVARWPLFGTLARLQRTVFVERQVRRSAEQRDAISERLAAGDDLVLFPEGTSSDGNRVLPFKSALFAATEAPAGGLAIAVQPVSIAYTRLNGVPMGRWLRPFFAWYGDMEMAPHLWDLLGLGVVTVEVEFHPVVTRAEFPSRKALAQHCRRVVGDGLAAALSGRESPPIAVPSGEFAPPQAVGAQT